nr:ribonuclease H-like domain-containing protein [Tanacetum cinerariifolium]
MSNTNTNLQTQTSNALYNAIMEAGGKDRPPMLAPAINGFEYSLPVAVCPGIANTSMELKQIEADDQAIQTILLGLPKDIYATVDSYETAQEIWLRIQQMMKGSEIGIQEKKAKLFNE